MKIGELVNGLRYMVTNEQRQLINKLKEHSIERHNLEEREQYVAEQMTKSGLINRNYNEESQTVVYSLPKR